MNYLRETEIEVGLLMNLGGSLFKKMAFDNSRMVSGPRCLWLAEIVSPKAYNELYGQGV